MLNTPANQADAGGGGCGWGQFFTCLILNIFALWLIPCILNRHAKLAQGTVVQGLC